MANLEYPTLLNVGFAYADVNIVDGPVCRDVVKWLLRSSEHDSSLHVSSFVNERLFPSPPFRGKEDTQPTNQ